jgi:hypothetical protein
VVAVSSGSADAPATPVFTNPLKIDNPYLPLSTHRRCEFRGEGSRSVLTLLNTTRRFDVSGRPVDVAVLRDDAYERGKLVERTRDYFAQADDGTVYYFGEDVDNIRNGRVVDHDGTWLYGKHTDALGVAMLPNPKVGEQYHFEDVPGVTTESNRVEETGARAEAGGRLHANVIRISEFIQPEGELEHKLYAPGVGTIVSYDPEGRSELVRCR